MEELIEWCKENREQIKSLLEDYKSGKLKLFEGSKDITEQWINIHESELKELEAIIERNKGFE